MLNKFSQAIPLEMYENNVQKMHVDIEALREG